MTPASTLRVKAALVTGGVGYIIPVVTCFVPGAPGIPLPFYVLRVIVPIVNLTAQYPVDPDWAEVIGFIGVVNALTYGLVGLLIGHLLVKFKGVEE